MTGKRHTFPKPVYVPDGWHEIAPTKSMRDARIFFAIDLGTLRRIEDQTGVTCKRQVRPEVEQRRHTQAVRPSALREAGIELDLYRLAMGAWRP